MAGSVGCTMKTSVVTLLAMLHGCWSCELQNTFQFIEVPDINYCENLLASSPTGLWHVTLQREAPHFGRESHPLRHDIPFLLKQDQYYCMARISSEVNQFQEASILTHPHDHEKEGNREETAGDHFHYKFILTQCITPVVHSPIRESHKLGFPKHKCVYTQVKNFESIELHYNHVEGVFSCSNNNSDHDESNPSVKLEIKEVIQKVVPTVADNTSVIVSSVLIIVTIVLLFVAYKVWTLRQSLMGTGLLSFERGNPSKVIENQPLSDHAIFLPYDTKWDYPKKNLTMGRVLGEGYFGKVIQAEAKYVIKDEPVTVVALKKSTRKTHLHAIVALASELKLMAYISHHLNVVNLLGTCWRSLTQQKMLVVYEFCPFGNLQEYLIKKKNVFVNEVDPLTGEITAEVKRRVRKLLEDYSTRSLRTSVSVTNSSSAADLLRNEPTVLENAVSEDELRNIKTRDLIFWTFQVAKGMDYLSSLKILHGELAARNVLLTQNNIVKICNIGVCRTYLKYDPDFKTEKARHALRWMPPESVRDHIFSTHSDVWSFGVFMWELFSLGGTPYANLDSEDILKYVTQQGRRLDEPPYSTAKMFRIMQHCWQIDPYKRPQFSLLSKDLELHQEDSVLEVYKEQGRKYSGFKKMEDEDDDFLADLQCAPSSAGRRHEDEPARRPFGHLQEGMFGNGSTSHRPSESYELSGGHSSGSSKPKRNFNSGNKIVFVSDVRRDPLPPLPHEMPDTTAGTSESSKESSLPQPGGKVENDDAESITQSSNDHLPVSRPTTPVTPSPSECNKLDESAEPSLDQTVTTPSSESTTGNEVEEKPELANKDISVSEHPVNESSVTEPHTDIPVNNSSDPSSDIELVSKQKDEESEDKTPTENQEEEEIILKVPFGFVRRDPLPPLPVEEDDQKKQLPEPKSHQ